MKQIIVVIAVLAVATAAAGFLFFRGATVQLEWGGQAWPKTVRGTGEAVERVVHTGRGKPTPADRARARERARWKAYYYAQLRLAEQLGGLQLDAHTTVHDAVLADREVRAAYSGTIRAAAAVPSGDTVEDLPDAVRVRMTVEAPSHRVLGLHEAVVRALAGGRITLKAPARAAAAPSAREAKAASNGAPAEAPDRSPSAADPANEVSHRPASPPPAPRRRHAGKREVRYTGCVVHLPDTPDALVAAPDFYDSAGTYLGSALDLPDRVPAGVPVADPADSTTIEKIAGSHPAELAAVVTAGNVMIERQLSRREAELFALALKDNRVILVLGGEAG